MLPPLTSTALGWKGLGSRMGRQVELGLKRRDDKIKEIELKTV